MNINEERRRKYDEIKKRLSEMEHGELMGTIDKIFKLIEEQDLHPDDNNNISYILAVQDNLEIYDLLMFELSERKKQAISDYRDFLL